MCPFVEIGSYLMPGEGCDDRCASRENSEHVLYYEVDSVVCIVCTAVHAQQDPSQLSTQHQRWTRARTHTRHLSPALTWLGSLLVDGATARSLSQRAASRGLPTPCRRRCIAGRGRALTSSDDAACYASCRGGDLPCSLRVEEVADHRLPPRR